MASSAAGSSGPSSSSSAQASISSSGELPADLAQPNSSTAQDPSQPSSTAPQGKDAQAFKVPWGVGKIIQVMVLWLLAYIIIGQVAVPMGLSLLGIDRDELSIRGHALLHLALDVSQLAGTLLILWGCLKDYHPARRGLFPVKLRGTWPLAVIASTLVFPAVDWVAQQSMSWFPTEVDGQWACQMETSLSEGDWITQLAYFSVVSVCAPIWEELIFRGFLLVSLTRYMSSNMAILVSSLLFAMCHFRLQTFFPLLILGIVFSYLLLRFRNLLPPIILHSAWNVFVLVNLLYRPM